MAISTPDAVLSAKLPNIESYDIHTPINRLYRDSTGIVNISVVMQTSDSDRDSNDRELDPIESSPPPEDHQDSGGWIWVNIAFARCCYSTLKILVIPSLLVDDVEAGKIVPLGWDERNGVLFADAHGGLCSACLRRLREAVRRLGVEDDDQAQSFETQGSGRVPNEDGGEGEGGGDAAGDAAGDGDADADADAHGDAHGDADADGEPSSAWSDEGE